MKEHKIHTHTNIATMLNTTNAKVTQRLSSQLEGHLGYHVTIVPTPRGISSHAPLLLCPEGIIPRVGRTGISITLILGQRFFSSLSDHLVTQTIFTFDNEQDLHMSPNSYVEIGDKHDLDW